LASRDASLVNAGERFDRSSYELRDTTNELVAPLGIEKGTLCDHGTSFAASRLRP